MSLGAAHELFQLDPGGPVIHKGESGLTVKPPPFHYSTISEVFALGYTVCLHSILLIVIMMTANFHYPLVKSNFIMQAATITYLFIFRVASAGIVFHVLSTQIQEPPYTFRYTQVLLPLIEWPFANSMVFLVFDAILIFLPHFSFLQLLKLKFPSKIEKSIINVLLVLAAVTGGVNIGSAWDGGLAVDLCDAIQDSIQAVLFITYLGAGIAWGVLVNRKRAWQYDGGALGFGCISMIISCLCVALSFVQVLNSKLIWVQYLLPIGLLWNTWVSFWWWVSAGMWNAEVSDLTKKVKNRENTRRKRRYNVHSPVRSWRDDRTETVPMAHDEETAHDPEAAAAAAAAQEGIDDERAQTEPAVTEPSSTSGSRWFVTRLLDMFSVLLEPVLNRLQDAHNEAVLHNARNNRIPRRAARFFGIDDVDVDDSEKSMPFVAYVRRRWRLRDSVSYE